MTEFFQLTKEQIVDTGIRASDIGGVDANGGAVATGDVTPRAGTIDFSGGSIGYVLQVVEGGGLAISALPAAPPPPDSHEFLQGAGAPSDLIGNDGDGYFDQTNAAIYEKVSGSWVSVAELTVVMTGAQARALVELDGEPAGAMIETALQARTDSQNRAFLIGMNGFAREDGATHAAGAPLVGGATAHEVAYGATAPILPATLSEYLTGTDDEKFVTAATARYMAKTKALAFADPLTVLIDGARIVDGDDHDSDTLNNSVSVTAAVDIGFDDIHAGVVGEEVLISCINSGGGTFAIDVVTANGVTVEFAPNVSNPGLGTANGDRLDIVCRIVSTTLVRVERFIQDDA